MADFELMQVIDAIQSLVMKVASATEDMGGELDEHSQSLRLLLETVKGHVTTVAATRIMLAEIMAESAQQSIDPSAHIIAVSERAFANFENIAMQGDAGDVTAIAQEIRSISDMAEEALLNRATNPL